VAFKTAGLIEEISDRMPEAWHDLRAQGQVGLSGAEGQKLRDRLGLGGWGGT